jgi:hypothetical protein
LSVMQNKLKENANWFSIDVQQKTYVRIRIERDVMKHLIFRFFKNSICMIKGYHHKMLT